MSLINEEKIPLLIIQKIGSYLDNDRLAEISRFLNAIQQEIPSEFIQKELENYQQFAFKQGLKNDLCVICKKQARHNCANSNSCQQPGYLCCYNYDPDATICRICYGLLCDSCIDDDSCVIGCQNCDNNVCLHCINHIVQCNNTDCGKGMICKTCYNLPFSEKHDARFTCSECDYYFPINCANCQETIFIGCDPSKKCYCPDGDICRIWCDGCEKNYCLECGRKRQVICCYQCNKSQCHFCQLTGVSCQACNGFQLCQICLDKDRKKRPGSRRCWLCDHQLENLSQVKDLDKNAENCSSSPPAKKRRTIHNKKLTPVKKKAKKKAKPSQNANRRGGVGRIY